VEVKMRLLVRNGLIMFLIAALVELPVLAAPAAPLGFVIQARDSLISSATAVQGATIFAGDQLETGADGSLSVRIGAGQVLLLPSSAATFEGDTGHLRANLKKGSLAFSSTGTGAFELLTPVAVVRPKGTGPANARIMVTGPDSLILASYRGALEVEASGETYTIPENTAYRLVLEKDEPASLNSDPHRARRSRRELLLLLLAGGAGAGLGIGIWAATHPPPSRPKVSPSAP
jgi:hypothetical protein